jgi:23S rRNA (uracil747-C5)-methyltransferase
MQCEHFDAGRCRSCSLLRTPYAVQLADKVAALRARLDSVVEPSAWQPPFASAPSGFRNKAKLVVGGTPGAVTLGILDGDQRGVDLRDCGLYEPALAAALPAIGDWLDALRLLPYDVAKRRGELKHVHVTASPAGDLMVRVVLRSERQAERVRSGVAALQAALPRTRVVTVNLLPDHVARLEGADEEVLTPERTLVMDLGRVRLHLGPRAFFQTNTAVARGLYEEARTWIGGVGPSSVLDLYCGVGGFGLHAATLPGAPAVHGVEVSAEAVASARHTASELGSQGTVSAALEFSVGDATAAVAEADCVVVNPPRRGIGPDLAAEIEGGPARSLVYSSCNPTTLHADLARLPGFRVERARLFDMFPHTTHAEVLVLATRSGP